MKTIMPMIVLGLSMALPALAQTKPTEQQPPLGKATSATQIVAKYLKAIGGTESWRKLKTQILKGSYQDPDDGSALNVEVQKKAPNKWGFTIRDAGGTVVQQGGFNGKEAWEGADTMEAEMAVILGRMNGLWSGVELEKMVPKIKSVANGKSDGKDVLILEAPFHDGKLEKLYFETDTGLLVREDFDEITVRYGDYRMVDDVKLPYLIRMTKGESGGMILQVKEIRHNIDIKDTVFNRPKHP